MSTIGERLRLFRKSLQLAQNEVSMQLGVQQGSYSDIERNKTKGSISIYEKLDTVYNLNINWLLSGEGNMFNDKKEGNVSLMGDVMGKPNVIISNIPVNGGGAIASQIIEIPSVAYFPMCKKNTVAFPLQGKSMIPIFESGDWLLTTTVENLDNVKSGKVYILKLKDGTLYCKYIDKKGSVWVLRSENWRDYAPIEVSANDIEKVYQIDLRMTTVFGWEN